MFGMSLWKTLQKNSLKKCALCFLSVAGIPCRFTMLGIAGFFLTHARYFCILLNSQVRQTSSSNCVRSASTSLWISFDNRFILSSSLTFGTPVFLFLFNVSGFFILCDVGQFRAMFCDFWQGILHYFPYPRVPYFEQYVCITVAIWVEGMVLNCLYNHSPVGFPEPVCFQVCV